MATIYTSTYDPTTKKEVKTASETNQTWDSSGKAIPVDGLNSPVKPVDLSNIDNGIKSGLFEVPPPSPINYTPPSVDTNKAMLDSYMSELNKADSNRTSSVDMYKTALQDSGIQSKEAEVNASTQELANINAEIQAISDQAREASLRLESQSSGKDVTSSFLGRQQQEISRQSAIKALPLQAQGLIAQAKLSGSQATLQQAQDKLSTLFKLQSDDADRAYNTKIKTIDAVYNFASKAEQARLDALKETEAIKRDEVKAIENRKNTITDSIIKSDMTSAEKSALINEISSADSSDKVNAVAGKITAKTTVSTEQIKLDDGTIKLVDSNTGKIIASYGGGTGVTPAKENASLGLVNDINNVLADPNIDSVFGVWNSINRNVPGTSAYTLSSQVNNVIQQAALAARGQLKGQGTVSDFEGKMLKEAQTALKLNMNPADAKKALAKLRGAITTSSGGSAQVVITDKNSVAKEGLANQEMINQAISSGYRVEYK